MSPKNPQSPDAINEFHQPAQGYRFSADSIYLAEQAEFGQARQAADFGAGCGVVGLCALEKKKPPLESFFFVERQPDFWPHLSLNLALYQPRTQTRLRLVTLDWRLLSIEHFGGPLDYILVNPPYFSAGSGRPSPNPGREAARRLIYGDMSDLFKALCRLLSPAGRALVMSPQKLQPPDERIKLISPPAASSPAP